MDMTAIMIVFIVVGMPVIGVFVLIALKIMKGASSSGGHKAIEEETRIIQEIYRGMSHMEERVDTLETIILSREKKEEE